MEWNEDINKLINGKSYLVCLNLINEVYDVLHFFKQEHVDVNFKEKGFYFFNHEKGYFEYNKIQPEKWMDIF